MRWLSRVKVLGKLYELPSDAQVFLKESKFELCNCYIDEIWLSLLAYLSDISGKLNERNYFLQDSNETLFTVNNQINVAVKKRQYIIKNV